MQQDLRKIWKPKKLEREIRIRMSTPALDQDDPGFSLLTTTTPESSLSRMRKLMRDIKDRYQRPERLFKSRGGRETQHQGYISNEKIDARHQDRNQRPQRLFKIRRG